MTEADVLREEHFKRKEVRAAFVCQEYILSRREIWVAEHERVSAVLFGEQDKEAEAEKKIAMLKEKFFIKTGHEFDEVETALL